MNHSSSYFGGRQARRPDSFMGDGGNSMSRAGSYYDVNNAASGNGYGGPSNGYNANRARYPRTNSEPMLNNMGGVYPTPGGQPSYETVTTASGSGSEPLGYSTDPSSDNSSADRIPAAMKTEHGESYGTHNNGNPQYPGAAYNGNGQYAPSGNGMDHHNQANMGPPPPQHQSVERVPIKLGSAEPGAPTVYEAPQPQLGGKRKSWFGRKKSSKN